jgi:hypothetical protein
MPSISVEDGYEPETLSRDAISSKPEVTSEDADDAMDGQTVPARFSEASKYSIEIHQQYTFKWGELGMSFNRRGEVTRVHDDKQARKLGILKGMKIIEFNGEEFHLKMFNKLLSINRATVREDGKELTLTMQLPVAVQELQKQRASGKYLHGKWKYPINDISDVTYALPESIYSSALVVLLSLDPHDQRKSCTYFLFVYLPQLFLLVFTYCVQSGIIYYINKTTEDSYTCDFETSLMLIYMGVGLFVGGMIEEFVETLRMLSWTWHVQTEKERNILTYENVTEDGEKKIKLASGLTRYMKIMFVLLILLPKLGIAGALTQCGAKFVAVSRADSDVVLNCLAMVFVVEIDDMLYKTFTPVGFQKMLRELPPVEVEDEKDSLVVHLMLLPWLKVGLWGGLSAVFVGAYSCIE